MRVVLIAFIVSLPGFLVAQNASQKLDEFLKHRQINFTGSSSILEQDTVVVFAEEGFILTGQVFVYQGNKILIYKFHEDTTIGNIDIYQMRKRCKGVPKPSIQKVIETEFIQANPKPRTSHDYRIQMAVKAGKEFYLKSLDFSDTIAPENTSFKELLIALNKIKPGCYKKLEE